MNEKTANSLATLAKAIENDPRMIELKKAEKLLNEDPEAQALSKKKDLLTEAFEEARFHFGEESAQAKEAWRSLYLIKKELDELPSCVAYRKAYAPMAMLFRQMDAILFDAFRDESECGGKI